MKTKVMTDAAILSEGLPKRSPKNWGIVAAPKCWVMMRVRRPSTTQAKSEPSSALPMPIQVEAMPNFQPNCPA